MPRRPRGQGEQATNSQEHLLAEEDPPSVEPQTKVTMANIFKQFVFFGWIAFGGPAAHIGLFQKTFVERLKWMTNEIFAELLSLCQCLPGPTSTQMSFSLGMVHGGIPGSIMSGLLFQYPGLLIMSLVGFGAGKFLTEPSPVLKACMDGLGAAGVALVASAAKGLFSKLCTTRILQIISVVCVVGPFFQTTNWLLPLLLFLGAVTSLVALWKDDKSTGESTEEHTIQSLGVGMVGGGILLTVWASVLIAVVILRNRLPYEDYPYLHWFESFYRTGSLIFGGGQVVLPMLKSDLVQQSCIGLDCKEQGVGLYEGASWVTSDQFYTGLAVVQALPGPLFNFSAYLGAVISRNVHQNGFAGIATCWIGLFGPGLLVIYGILPFWSRFRHIQLYRKVLPGLNAAAVGFIIAAVFSMMHGIQDNSLYPHFNTCIMIIAFSLVELKVPAPLTVVSGGLLGLLGQAVNFLQR